ncbi:MAG: serine hydrolase [Bacteroidota bacterium]
MKLSPKYKSSLKRAIHPSKFRLPALLLLVIYCHFSCEKEHVTITSSFYAPLELDDWDVSTPEDQGLDTTDVKEMYQVAAQMDNLYGLLLIKDGYLVAERYFNGKSVSTARPIASITKSYTSTLTGIALEKGYLTSLDQTMAEFFPEFDWESMDTLKSQITIRQILKMRSGYPWEEFSDYNDLLWSSFGDWLPLIEEIPLAYEPGNDYGYSNLMSHILGIIVSRAADTSLYDFAKRYLCEPLGVSIPVWWADSDGYNYGHGDIHSTARDLARFGELYLNEGLYKNTQIISSGWIVDALLPYSFDLYGREIFDHFKQLNMGYMNWFSAVSGNYTVYFSWGHGGQHIFLIPDLNIIVVTTADYMPGQDGEKAWEKQKSITDMVGKYISRLH